jgi:signal transduction histidine kinase
MALMVGILAFIRGIVFALPDLTLLAYVEIIGIPLFFTMLYLLRKQKRNFVLVANIMAFLVILVFDSLILFTDASDIKFAWIFIFLSIYTFIKGTKKGLKWIGILVITIILLKLQSFYLISYSNYQIAYIIFLIVIATGLTSFYLFHIEKNFELILKQQNELEKFNQQLEDRVAYEVEKNKEKDALIYQQAKMASMGEMIGNIAHQWRQPLNAINITIASIQVDLMFEEIDSKKLDEELQKISKTTLFLSETIDNFRNYFKSEQHIEKLNIATIINDNINIIKSNFDTSFITLEYDNIECHVDIAKNEFSQVLINILNNAKDILDTKELSSKNVYIKTVVNSEYLTLKISDNAGGVPDEILNHIFDPYFTTKEKTQGTGIGLYMSKEIVSKQLHGTLSVKNIEFHGNNEEKGAEFTITLPLS